MQAKFSENFVVTILTVAHLLWIHVPYCTHKNEVTYRHHIGKILDNPSFAMSPLTITFIFPRLTFKPLLSKASCHFQNLFMSPSIVSLTLTKSSAYSNSLSKPSGQLSDNIYHKCKKEKLTAQILGATAL